MSFLSSADWEKRSGGGQQSLHDRILTREQNVEGAEAADCVLAENGSNQANTPLVPAPPAFGIEPCVVIGNLLRTPVGANHLPYLNRAYSGVQSLS